MATFRPGKPKLILRRVAPLPGAGSAPVDIPWDTVIEEDPVGQWNPATPTVVTIDRTGLYLVNWHVVRGSVVTAATFFSTLKLNTVNHLRTFAGATQQSVTANASLLWEFVIGDQLVLGVTPSNVAGNAWSVAGGTGLGCVLSVVRVGPERWT